MEAASSADRLVTPAKPLTNKHRIASPTSGEFIKSEPSTPEFPTFSIPAAQLFSTSKNIETHIKLEPFTPELSTFPVSAVEIAPTPASANMHLTTPTTTNKQIKLEPVTPKFPTFPIPAAHLPATPTSEKRIKTEPFTPKVQTFAIPAPHFPPTPARTPELSLGLSHGTKRCAPTEPDSPSAGRAAKRLATTLTTASKQTSSQLSTPATSDTPSKAGRYRAPCLNQRYITIYTPAPVRIYQDRFSSLELQRLTEEILAQVDWEGLEESVACNRPGRVYKQLIKSFLLGEMSEARRSEEKEGEETEESDSDDEEEEDE